MKNLSPKEKKIKKNNLWCKHNTNKNSYKVTVLKSDTLPVVNSNSNGDIYIKNKKMYYEVKKNVS